jgi:hypothetical protein
MQVLDWSAFWGGVLHMIGRTSNEKLARPDV